MATKVIDSFELDSNKYVFTVPYAVCSTVAATAAKVVTIDNFTLETSASIAVKFTVTNTAANPTLNVNSTGAKAIYYNGAAISAGLLKANKVYLFFYNGTQYDFVGDIAISSVSSSGSGNAVTDISLSNGVLTVTKGTSFLPTSGGTLSGNLTGRYLTGTWLQTTAAGNLNATPPYIAVIDSSGWVYKRTPAELYADIAQDSGVNAGSYGPTANASPAHGGTFSVPQVTVDAKGRVTGAASRTITMPAAPTASSLGCATTAVYTTTIGTTWSGSAAPYTQTITVSGILASDTPIVDVNLSGVDYSNKDAVIEAYAKVYRITTAANSITVYADEATSTAIPIQLKVVR